MDIVPGNSTLPEMGPAKARESLVTSYLQHEKDPSTPTLLTEVEGGDLEFDNGVLFIDHFGWLLWGWCVITWGWC